MGCIRTPCCPGTARRHCTHGVTLHQPDGEEIGAQAFGVQAAVGQAFHAGGRRSLTSAIRGGRSLGQGGVGGERKADRARARGTCPQASASTRRGPAASATGTLARLRTPRDGDWARQYDADARCRGAAPALSVVGNREMPMPSGTGLVGMGGAAVVMAQSAAGAGGRARATTWPHSRRRGCGAVQQVVPSSRVRWPRRPPSRGSVGEPAGDVEALPVARGCVIHRHEPGQRWGGPPPDMVGIDGAP